MNAIPASAPPFPNNVVRQSQKTENENQKETSPETKKHSNDNTENKTESTAQAHSNSVTILSDVDKKQVAELKARDAEVRTHEAAHKAAGGSLTGAATFSYQKGPDGRRYAIGGEVSIDTSPVSGDPYATLQKANQIRAAANAPAQPSAQDRSVAASAAAMASEARAQIIKENSGVSPGSEPDENTAADNSNELDVSSQSKESTPAASSPNKMAQQAYQTSKVENAAPLQGSNIDLIV